MLRCNIAKPSLFGTAFFFAYVVLFWNDKNVTNIESVITPS